MILPIIIHSRIYYIKPTKKYDYNPIKLKEIAMNIIDTLGFIAAFCTTASFLPQALKVLKTRDTSALSLGMYALFTLGVSFWLVYGLLKNDAPMIIANIITLFLAVFILGMKIHSDLSPSGPKNTDSKNTDSKNTVPKNSPPNK